MESQETDLLGKKEMIEYGALLWATISNYIKGYLPSAMQDDWWDKEMIKKFGVDFLKIRKEIFIEISDEKYIDVWRQDKEYQDIYFGSKEERSRQLTSKNFEQKRLKFISRGSGGYNEYEGKSNRALRAENEKGLFTIKDLSEELELTQKFLKSQNIPSEEWHHTGDKFKQTYYYSLRNVVLYLLEFGGFEEAIQEKQATVEKIKEIITDVLSEKKANEFILNIKKNSEQKPMFKAEIKIEVPENLWRKELTYIEPENEKILWKLSLIEAIKKGIIRDEILALMLSYSTISHLKNQYILMQFPSFYNKYYLLKQKESKIILLENLLVNFAINNSFEEINTNKEFKDKRFFYDRNTQNIKSNDEIIGFVNNASIYRYYGAKVIKKEDWENVKGEIELVYTGASKSGKTLFFQSLNPYGNIFQSKEIKQIESEISELKDYFKALTEEEAKAQEQIYIEELNKLEKSFKTKLRNIEKSPEQKQIEKEKAEAKADKKAIEIEQLREIYIKENNIPVSIDEFLKREYKTNTDVAKGDVVLFTEAVFSGSYPDSHFEGDRRILGIIEKESYGSDKGQHSFTIYVLDSDGQDMLTEGEKIVRKGRNVYKKDFMYLPLASEKVREEKHERGQAAKNSKYWTWLNEAEHEGKEFKLDKIPSSFIHENKDQIKEMYPQSANKLNLSGTEKQKRMFFSIPVIKISKYAESDELIKKNLKMIIDLNGSIVPKDELLLFIINIQKDNEEKKFNLKSKYYKEIILLETSLVDLYNSTKKQSVKLELDNNIYKHWDKIIESINVDGNVCNKGMRIQTLLFDKEKFKKQQAISWAKRNGFKYDDVDEGTDSARYIRLRQDDPENYIKTIYKTKKLPGTEGIKATYGCLKDSEEKTIGEPEEREEKHDSEPGTEKIITVPEKNIKNMISAKELQNQKWRFYNLQEPWKKIFGEVTKPFYVLLYGAPKSYKSTMAILFADYFSKHFGNVLYVAAEEYNSPTMQSRMKRLNIDSDKLYISKTVDEITEDMIPDLVIIDTINMAKIRAEKTRELKEKYPQTSFIFMAQVTKDGDFRGEQDIAHEVDLIIEVKNGEAFGNGRFIQGGYLNIKNLS